MPDYWDRTVGRFRDSGGRFVSDKSVRGVVDDIADGASARMADLSRRLIADNVTLAQWQTGMRQLIKESQTATSVIALGGSKQMTPQKWGSIGHAVRDQYAYLDDFAAGIASGDIPLGDGLVARAALYGQQARAAFEVQRGHSDKDIGYQYERNVLDAAAAHCDQCASLSSQGWVPIGTLTPIGSRTCLANDRCSIERRFKLAGAS